MPFGGDFRRIAAATLTIAAAAGAAVGWVVGLLTHHLLWERSEPHR